MVDAVVVGSGPNGLAAAITIAETGREVLVIEGADRVGGGMRTEEATLPGFRHDICSAIHPLGVASPFFLSLDLAQHGLEWIEPDVQVAHPLDDGSAPRLLRSLDESAAEMGEDAASYRRLVGPLVSNWDDLAPQLLGPLLRFPRHPIQLGRFGLRAALPARTLARTTFDTEQTRALFAGLAAHSILPLGSAFTASFGITFAATAHIGGWPLPRGGSQSIADAMAAHLRSLGGSIETGDMVRSLSDLPPAGAYLLDVTPTQLSDLAGEALPGRYRRRLRQFRFGPAAFKVDFALDAPVPWIAEDPRRAGTVHLGGSLDEITVAEAAVAKGDHPDRPLVLVAQQSLFDETRAPEGKHTLWAYCHVPNGSTVDMTDRIEDQIERFAPGFRERILARAVHGPERLEARNPNYVGGDIAGGSHGGLQLIARPMISGNPYSTPLEGVYLCSSSTPPGAGVHGMCGYHAAKTALAGSLR